MNLKNMSMASASNVQELSDIFLHLISYIPIEALLSISPSKEKLKNNKEQQIEISSKYTNSPLVIDFIIFLVIIIQKSI